MTTSSRKYPTRVEVKHNGKTGWIAIDQIRTIDKVRVIKTLGTLNKSEILEVKSVINEMYTQYNCVYTNVICKHIQTHFVEGISQKNYLRI
jgi:hypothetical protein